MQARSTSGWLEVITGPMFSGKSEELIRRLRRAIIAKQIVQAFKPQVDARYNSDKFVSHIGNQFNAAPVDNALDILRLLDPTTTLIAIDEAQFFDRQILDICEHLVHKNIRVIIAGLDLDFRGEPFGPMPLLLAQAEYVTKLHAICMICQRDATRTQRLINGSPAGYDEPILLVGGAESYEARCRQCHVVPAQPNISHLQAYLNPTH
jgi:thymidine kinase